MVHAHDEFQHQKLCCQGVNYMLVCTGDKSAEVSPDPYPKAISAALAAADSTAQSTVW